MFTKPLRGTQLNRSHPLARGLVGCWLFNEGCGNKAYDLSGYGNHGTLTSMAFPPTTVSSWNPGKNGIGLAFDGSNDHVNCGNDASLNITDAITIEAWVKTEDVSGEKVITEKYQDAVAGHLLRIRDNKAYICGREGSESWRESGLSTTIVSDGEWHHIVGIINVNLWEIWVDGVKENYLDTEYYTTDLRNSEDVNIGALWGGGGYFNGSIDGVKIYNRALSAEEIKWLYHEPYAMFEPEGISGMLYPPVAAVVNSNLAAMGMLR